MQWLSIASDVIGVLGGMFAFFAWVQASRIRKDVASERQRQDAQIKVILRHGSETYQLPVSLRRAELTRAELLGRLGMIPIKKDDEGKEQKRFSIAYFNSKEFFERLNEIILGSGSDVLIIPCQDAEFNQFNI
ncbi:MAG TPA: hypothetical protein VJ972_13790 [Anaerolineales bacterium]|nr:hypothetical protein [Anaerolineales bacterium]